MLGCAWLNRGRQAAQRVHVVVELTLRCRCHGADSLVEWTVGIFLSRAGVDLVIDIRDVAHIADMISTVDVPQHAKEHVEDDDGARVANMGKVVNGRSADIDAYARWIDRLKQPFLPGQRVVESQFHARPFGPADRRASMHFDEKRRPRPAKVASEEYPGDCRKSG